MKFHVFVFFANPLDMMEMTFHTFKEALNAYREAESADIWFGFGDLINPFCEDGWRLIAFK